MPENKDTTMNDDPTTPQKPDDPKVISLLAEIRRVGGGISPDARPVYVQVAPEPGAGVNSCFITVSEKVKVCGGKMILGWTLREEALIMSAEFHAVWESLSGDWLDVTPKGELSSGGVIVHPTSRILFITAPEAEYRGKRVNNIPLNISGDPLVDDYIACNQALFAITNRGERAYQRDFREIVQDMGVKENDAASHLAECCKMLRDVAGSGMTKESPCPCGSGKNFGDCHWKEVPKAIEGARPFVE